MSSSIDPQRRELYVGLFPTHYWTPEFLCDYFHRLIEGSSITDCRFYPCSSATKPSRFVARLRDGKRQLILADHSFAILTFAKAFSVDECLAKRVQIRAEYRVTVKRNLRGISRDQRAICQHISVHLTTFGEKIGTFWLIEKEKILFQIRCSRQRMFWPISVLMVRSGNGSLSTDNERFSWCSTILIPSIGFYSINRISSTKLFYRSRNVTIRTRLD